MDYTQQAESVIDRFVSLDDNLSNPEVLVDRIKFTEFSRVRKSLIKTVEKSKEYLSLLDDVKEWEEVKQGDDSEMKAAAEQELIPLYQTKKTLEEELKILLIPKDKNDLKNAILEIRAGTGGDEASIFSGDLFRMYQMYAESQGWQFKVMSFSEGTVGGYKEIVCEVSGKECYGTLKFESGVHRVQRVPTTESQGRVHTSAATVAVMPEAEEVDLAIKENDLRIDVYRSSGHGGQSVNTTDSAVRITHLPSGMIVTCQDEKSQLKNKDKAMKVLRSRLLDLQIAKQEKERSANRKLQVGTGDRSAKIRTYNFPQGRVTDHRINLTLYALDQFMKGEINEVIDALKIADNNEKLSEMIQ